MVKELLAARLSDLLKSPTIQESLCEEIADLVYATNNIQVAETLQNSVDAVKLFKRLFAASFTSEVITDLIRKLLRCPAPVVLLSDFQSIIMQGLNHNNPKVREITLQELDRCTKNELDLSEFIHHPDIVSNAVKLLGDPNLSVAKFSIEITTSLGKSPEGISTLLSTPIKNVIDDILSRGNDTKRMRVYDALITISCEQPTALPLIAAEYSMQLLSELESDDILLKLNCVEILTKLALTNHGLVFLEHQGIVEKFRNLLLESSGFESFLYPSLIKFFGNLGLQNPNLLSSEYPDVLQFILKGVDSDDTAVKFVAIETVGTIGMKKEGKIMLDKFRGTALNDCLSSIGQQAERGSTETKPRAIKAIADLLYLDKEVATPEIDTIVEKWFKKFTYRGTLQMLLSLARMPFLEIRCEALTAIKNIATREWGQRLLSSSPGFIEYLLDRSTESDKKGKEVKYAIAVAILQSNTSSSVFDNEMIQKLTDFCKDGPFYVGSVTEISFEQAS